MKVFIVAHDAGGSEVVAAWVKAHPEYQYDFFLAGPAIQIFQKRLIADLKFFAHDQIQSQLKLADRVITTSSWGSDIEKQTWIWSKELQVESILYADGWADFRNGFRLKGRDYYPDQIWVTNEYARENMIRVGAPSDRIEIVENFYIRQMRDRVYERERKLNLSKDENRILYVSENISACESAYEIKTDEIIRGYDEFDALEGFLKLAKAEKFGSKPFIRVRPHPSETAQKYEKICASAHGLQVEFSKPGTSLEEDLAWASQVVGCETMALAVAIECHKKAISCIPSKARIQCRLPHKELLKLHS